MPRGKKKNPITDLPGLDNLLSLGNRTTTAVSASDRSGTDLSDVLNLPSQFSINLPNFQGFAESAIGVEPNGSLPRVTDAQREEHALVYREQMNAADNLKDSIKVANKYVLAGIEATKLGKSLIQYQTGIQDMLTERVNYDKAVTRTTIAQAELAQLQLKLNHENALIPIVEQTFNHKLREAQAKAEQALRAAMKAESETELRYPTIQIEGQRVTAA